jgi:hypothetical protein
MGIVTTNQKQSSKKIGGDANVFWAAPYEGWKN